MAGRELRVIGGAWALGLVVAAAPLRVAAAPASATTPASTATSANATPPTDANAPTPAPASATPAASGAPKASDVPMTPRSPAFTGQDGWTTPRPGPTTSNAPGGPQDQRRWHIRQAPLAGGETSWGPPGGQMPEYAEIAEPQAAKGPPPRGTSRIISGAIVGPAGLGLLIAGIVGATTDMLGEHKRLSVPMIGVGVVSSAIGWGLFADGLLRRKKFLRWQAKGGEVALTPTLVPGRLAGVSLRLRF